MGKQKRTEEIQLQRRVYTSSDEGQSGLAHKELRSNEIEYRLIEYVREENWLMDDPKRHSESVTIGPHAHGTWISRTLSVTVPQNVGKAKITAQNVSVDFPTHVRISQPTYSNDNRTALWNVQSQVHDRYVTFTGTIEYVKWGLIDLERELLFKKPNGDLVPSPIKNGTYIVQLSKGNLSFSLYVKFPDGTETVLTPAYTSENGVEIFIDSGNEFKQITLKVKV